VSAILRLSFNIYKAENMNGIVAALHAATKTANRKAAAYAATWMVASVRNSRLGGETAAASMTPVETVGGRTC